MIFPRFQTRAQTVDSGYQALSFSGGVRPGYEAGGFVAPGLQ